ncbi:hypothetical protein SJ05684_c22870 [Sinorhizobium sojae CCBAU 05684]|uniref:Uncharacterized protein n=1 Tax=Sinorhizobium sojae CCBAU 05684 TaxID=716928 RepID=A0A249PCU0_9HYPH|nr:hypothetical protein SJ05684_c22870 [Sinorhizobium sojae CCBAU 05684]
MTCHKACSASEGEFCPLCRRNMVAGQSAKGFAHADPRSRSVVRIRLARRRPRSPSRI